MSFINSKEKYEPVICKKSMSILGRKIKSKLKGKSLIGKNYLKKLNSNKCMNGPCWHRFSQKNKLTKRENYKELKKISARKTIANKIFRNHKKKKKWIKLYRAGMMMLI